tara:strand:- start:522 stop:761 length:240 start_codon:yes stop_codon:yes gene_type:complete
MPKIARYPVISVRMNLRMLDEFMTGCTLQWLRGGKQSAPHLLIGPYLRSVSLSQRPEIPVLRRFWEEQGFALVCREQDF